MSEVKGYKGFNPNWTCHPTTDIVFQYEVGKTYEIDETPECCKRGFHFCEKLTDCFEYYEANKRNKFAEVLALGDIDTEGNKSCTNKIKIVREISWEEICNSTNLGKNNKDINNVGNSNEGKSNTGHWNLGSFNTGSFNIGDRNIGSYNYGFSNCGSFNTGLYNSGNYNTGDYNTGMFNFGDYNTGNFNMCDHSTGCFNTIIPKKIYMFNQPSDWTIDDWDKSRAKYVLERLFYETFSTAKAKEKTYIELKTNINKIAGRSAIDILTSNKKEAIQEAWNELPDFEKETVFSLPNFNKEIFEETTGIKVD